MKSRYIIAALGLAACTQAHAQSVTVYGVIDAGIEYLNHVGPADKSLVRMPSLTASSPSRLGFRGTEDLGGGVKAFFVLESGFGPDNGSLNYGGRLFGRQANVGLATPYGTLTLGRQHTMTLLALFDSDILGPNTYAMSDLDGALPNARSDNAVGYLHKIGAMTFGATYSLGRDAAGPAGPQATNCPGELAADGQACREWTALIKYDAERGGVSASFDKMRGGPGALFGLSRSDFSDERSTLNAYMRFGGVKVGGGLIHRSQTSAASFASNLVYAGALLPLSGPWVLDGQVAYLNVSNSGNDAGFVGVRMTYNFSRRTAAYWTAGRLINRGKSAVAVSPQLLTVAGAEQSGTMLGLRHLF